jgi:hypothetical protein
MVTVHTFYHIRLDYENGIFRLLRDSLKKQMRLNYSRPNLGSVFRIREILARIRILGSIPKITDPAVDPDPTFDGQVKIITCFHMMYSNVPVWKI